jgi:outer membrane protein TolC
MNPCRTLFTSVAIIFFAFSAARTLAAPAPIQAASPAAPLMLADFLKQVSEKNQAYQASDRTAKAARATANEGKLIYRPTLTGQAQSFVEGQHLPYQVTDKFSNQQYSLGIAQQVGIGFTGKVAYNQLEMMFPATQTQFGQSIEFSPKWYSFDFTQSLFRNFNGHEFDAQAEQAEAASLAKSFAQSYMTKTVLLEAESFYWNLALAREMVTMRKDALERAQRIFDWTNRRERLQLADRAEALQASTNLQARKLELRAAQDSERVAAQAFNSARAVLQSNVPEKLMALTPEQISTFDVPARSIQRDDVKAAEFQAKTTAASALLARERNKPTLELFGSIPLTQPEIPTGPQSIYFPAQARPGTTVGLKMTASLDVVTQSKIRQGYAAEAQAADWLYQRKVFEEERDWQDITAKFKEAKDRLKLFLDLEKTQKEKLTYERDRQQRGRSTLQQVFLFETDLQDAQTGRIRTLAELLNLNAQMKLYGVSYGVASDGP